MDWMALLDFVFQLLERCEPTQEGRLRAAQPGPRRTFAIWRGLRAQGLRGSELRQCVEDCNRRFDEAQPEEVAAFCRGEMKE